MVQFFGAIWPIVLGCAYFHSTKSPPPGRRRSRFGYDHRWWGESERRLSSERRSYWSLTRRPLPCLVFVAPILLAYEFGVLWLGGESADSLRTGADAWMRHVLAAVGLTDQWFLPLCLVVVLARLAGRRPARLAVRPGVAGGHGARERASWRSPWSG